MTAGDFPTGCDVDPGFYRAHGGMGWAIRPLILLAWLWQIGPSRVLPPSCRYSPSCSAYAIEAWTRYGAFAGSRLAVKRLLRCHPWGGCGIDPVP